MKTFMKKYSLLLFSLLLIVSCGGGAIPPPDENGSPDTDQSPSPSGEDSGGASPSDTSMPQDSAEETGQEMRSFDLSIRLGDSEVAQPSLVIESDFAAVSLFSQVSRVTVEVVISDTVFSTTELTRSTTDPLLYSGSISIPVDAEAELRAVAADADGRTLFDGNLRGVRAREFGTPAIQIILQRRVPVDLVPPPNTPPVIQGTIVGDASLAYAGTTTMTVDSQDPQGDTPLGYLWEVTSAPAGAPATGIITNANQRGATFTAPRVTGIFRVRVTVSDPARASATAEVVIYVSETGLDGTPDSGVILSDFPDCVNWNIGGRNGGCMRPDQAGNVSFTQTVPDRLLVNPVFRYTISGISRDYTATQLYAMGFRFGWTDTCGGGNFISLDASGNESLVDSSTLFVPAFVKVGLENEACQIRLQMTTPTALVQNYQTVLTFSDSDNNRNDEMDCDRDLSSTRPKVRLICPTTMTAVPQVIQVQFCDAQGDLSRIQVDGRQWSWKRDGAGRAVLSREDTGVGSFYANNPPATRGSYRLLVIPYQRYASNAELSAVGADGFIHEFSISRDNLIRPLVIQLGIHATDRTGAYNSGFYGNGTKCTFAVDPAMSLDIPADYFTRPR